MGLISANDAVNATVMIAQAMTDYADIWPQNIVNSKTMGDGSGGPFALGEGGTKWLDAAAKIQEAQTRLTALCADLPRDYWTGEDRNKFDTEIRQLEAQLGDSHNYAMAVGITLDVLCPPIAAWPAMCLVIGGIEMAEATAFYAAAASVVGDLGASEAIWAEGEAVTATCSTVLSVGRIVLIALMAAASAAIAISDAADIMAQEHNGDSGILAEFGKATVDSAGEVAMNVAVDRVNHRGEKEEPHEPGKHAKPEGGEELGAKGADGAKGSHGDEGESGSKGSEGSDGKSASNGTPSHAPRHAKPPEWKETYNDRLKDWGKEKGVEKAGDLVTQGPVKGTGLSALINGTAGAIDSDWNKPDAPDASDEDWGAGEE